MNHKAVFLDRDGVINDDTGHYYIYKPEDFKINAGIMDGLKLLTQHGFKLVVVTNQGGVAKGIYTEADVNKVHDHFKKELEKHHITLDAIYYCPHHTEVMACDCRKPKPGMILKALSDWSIDASRSYLIGDSVRDIEAGENAGLKQCFKIEKNSSILNICQQIIEKE